MRIRAEETPDWTAVHAVHVSAFERRAEADLVDALREQAEPVVSLVAERGGPIVGHILFTPVTLAGRPDLKIMGLAPLGVDPRHQRQGVGSALVRAGLDGCREQGFDAVVVLGHAGYYPRFGFAPSSRFGIGCEYDVPDDAFMVAELRPGALGDASGIVRYHALFHQVE